MTVKFSRYRTGVAQRVGRGIALLFHDRSTRRGWVVSSTPRPHFNPGKDPVHPLQEDGWAPGPVWRGRKSRPHRDSFPDCPAHSQSLYRLSYLPHHHMTVQNKRSTHGLKNILMPGGLTIYTNTQLRSLNHEKIKPLSTKQLYSTCIVMLRKPTSSDVIRQEHAK